MLVVLPNVDADYNLQIESEKAKLPKVTSFFFNSNGSGRLKMWEWIADHRKYGTTTYRTATVVHWGRHKYCRRTGRPIAQEDVESDSEVVHHDASGSGDELNLMCLTIVNNSLQVTSDLKLKENFLQSKRQPDQTSLTVPKKDLSEYCKTLYFRGCKGC